MLLTVVFYEERFVAACNGRAREMYGFMFPACMWRGVHSGGQLSLLRCWQSAYRHFVILFLYEYDVNTAI